MFVCAVASVDDARAKSLCEKLRSSRAAVAEDDDIGEECFEVAGGVFERFALRERRGAGGDVHYVGAEAECSQLEADSCARAWLDEEIDERFSAKSGDFFDLTRADVLERRCGGEEVAQFGDAEVGDGGEVFACPVGHERFHFAELSSHTASSLTPSVAVRRTYTRSPSAVGTFFPT